MPSFSAACRGVRSVEAVIVLGNHPSCVLYTAANDAGEGVASTWQAVVRLRACNPARGGPDSTCAKTAQYRPEWHGTGACDCYHSTGTDTDVTVPMNLSPALYGSRLFQSFVIRLQT